MTTKTMTPHRTLPDPSDFCPGCRRTACRCRADEAAADALHAASYGAGHAACAADGYDERPLTEWVYAVGHRTTWDPGPDGRPGLVHRMTPVRFAAFSWRAHHPTASAYAGWFRRTYGHDLAAYLAGYDDAGAGLPSAVDEPGAHARVAAALDAYGPAADGVGPAADAGL